MSKLLRKHIAQPDFELIEERFQLVQGQVVFALLNPEQRHVRKTGLFAELGIAQLTPGFTQVLRQLTVKIALHPQKVAKQS